VLLLPRCLFANLAAAIPTRIESDDINARAALADAYDLRFIAVGDWGRVFRVSWNTILVRFLSSLKIFCG